MDLRTSLEGASSSPSFWMRDEGKYKAFFPDAVPLGLESGAIPDSSFFASSTLNANHGARRARLNIARNGTLRGGWVANMPKKGNTEQYIQVDLLTQYRIIGVATQGRQDDKEWVTSFKISCSTESVTFVTVKDPVNTSVDQIFPGNNDQDTIVYNRLPESKLCRYVRLLPVTWNNSISLRMEIYGKEPIAGIDYVPWSDVFPDAVPLGIESGAIPDSSFSASASFNSNRTASRARLNVLKNGSLPGGWILRKKHTKKYIQVDLLSTYHIIGVGIQGRQDDPNWVTSFKVACSMDSITFDKVKDPANPQTDEIFPGNTDQDTIVYNRLPESMLCRYVRLLPVTWTNMISLRMELYGEEPIHVTTPIPSTMSLPTSSLTTSIPATPEPVTSQTTVTTPIPTTMSLPTTSLTTTTPERPGPETSQTTADTTTFQPEKVKLSSTLPGTNQPDDLLTFVPLKPFQRGIIPVTKPPPLTDLTTVEVTMADYETQMTSEDTPTVKNVAVDGSASTNGTRSHELKGVLRVIADMSDLQTVTFSFSLSMFLYFISMVTALILRCIVLWIRGLHKEKMETEKERPRLMYELVDF